jgi:hypothetical protein
MPAATRQHPRGNGRRTSGPAVSGFVRESYLMDRLPELLAAVIGGSLLGFGLVLAARRLTGGFNATDAGTAWLVAGAGIALVIAVDVAAAVAGGGVGPWLARCGVVCGVAAVAVPDRLGAGWLSLVAVAIAALPLLVRPRGRGWMHPDRIPEAPMPEPQASRRRPRPAAPDARDESHDRRPRLPGRLVQRQERYELPSGTDCLRGRVLLAVAAGGKTAHAHVGFCPAFTRTPNVRVETDYDGVEAVVSAAEVLPWGVRVECRLAEPADEPLEIPVDVFVQGTE